MAVLHGVLEAGRTDCCESKPNGATSGFTVAVPLAGELTMLTDAGFKVSPLSGSVLFAETWMVIGFVALVVAESPLATGG